MKAGGGAFGFGLGPLREETIFLPRGGGSGGVEKNGSDRRGQSERGAPLIRAPSSAEPWTLRRTGSERAIEAPVLPLPENALQFFLRGIPSRCERFARAAA